MPQGYGTCYPTILSMQYADRKPLLRIHLPSPILMSELVLRQSEPPSHIPPYHVAVDHRFGSLVLVVGIERLAQHAGVEESV